MKLGSCCWTKRKWNHIILRDKRYDGVLHLVTTADGIEETYTASNNTIRTEYLLRTQLLQRKLIRDLEALGVVIRVICKPATCGLSIAIQNRMIGDSLRSGFEAKLERIYNGTWQLIKRPGMGHLHKYLIEDPFTIPPDISTEKFLSGMIYLKSESSLHEREIFKRRLLGQNSYFKISKRLYESDQVTQYTSFPLTAIQYLLYSQEEQSSRKKLQIEETCFVWNARTFVIYKYLNIDTPLTILRIMVDSDLIQPIVPPFVKVRNTVTDSFIPKLASLITTNAVVGDRKYSGFRIAEARWAF